MQFNYPSSVTSACLIYHPWFLGPSCQDHGQQWWKMVSNNQFTEKWVRRSARFATQKRKYALIYMSHWIHLDLTNFWCSSITIKNIIFNRYTRKLCSTQVWIINRNHRLFSLRTTLKHIAMWKHWQHRLGKAALAYQ